MRRDDNEVRDMARLDEAQRRTRERLAAQQLRIDKRFNRMRQQMSRKFGEPTDNQQRIIAAALQLLNEVGLNNVSLRKLAAMVDMQAPALYWHFKNKDVLIDYMAEAILEPAFKDLRLRADGEAWQDWLIKACQRLRSAMLAHRDGGRIVAGAHFIPAVTLMKFFEFSLESLTSTGMALEQANLIVMTAGHFVFGNVIEQQAMPSTEEVEKLIPATFFVDHPMIDQIFKRALENVHTGRDEFEDALRLIVH
jgi:TetR/AcrR family tetracycline transcriptional repressor